ncbi:phosphoribosyltransferase [Maricaulis sp.]|uniref:phosphoribosyltransferase n=1 Tax=Maricaulis sp. TaxID=1486257 RepID=UPI003A955799
MPFENRTDAGEQLARALTLYKGQDVIVLALPRGGVPVAAKVARYLGAPLDLLLVRKIGVPMQPELAMGAILDGSDPVIVRNENVIRMCRISEDVFEEVRERELIELERRREAYLGDRPGIGIKDRIAIIVDDGIATGATVRAALKGLRLRGPKQIVLAIPVAPPDMVAQLRREVDDLVCLEQPDGFGAIGMYYRDFGQVSDAEVMALLGSAASGAPS